MKPMSPKVCQLGSVTSNLHLQLCTVNSDPRSKLLTGIGPNDTVRGPAAAAPVPPREPRPPARRAPGGRDAAPRTAAAAERACVHRTGSWSGAGDDSAVRRSGTVFRGHVLSARPTCMMVFIYLLLSVRQLCRWQYTIYLFLLLFDCIFRFQNVISSSRKSVIVPGNIYLNNK